MHVAKTLICPFSVFVAMCDRNPPTLQRTDGQTDVMLVAYKNDIVFCDYITHLTSSQFILELRAL